MKWYSEKMQISVEKSYPTPLSNSTLLSLLLLSLARQKHTLHSSTGIKKEYDYIIVGGGAAGSVVAGRLSEERSVNILLLEAGPEPPLLTEVPSLGMYFCGTDVDWKFKTVPQKYTGKGLINQQITLVVGRMLGGSSSLNGMAYVRGNRKNFDDWAAQGAKGWSYDEIFPYFLKLEDNRNLDFLANGYHAFGGPITVEQPRYEPELKRALYEAAPELGYKFVDPNAANQTGFYYLQANIRDNQRCSSAKGYLVPAEYRPNLNILLNAVVTKIIIEDGRATGVEFYFGDQVLTVKAKREIIMSAGTYNTPKILMLSGIGPREELQKFGIPVIADLPVGQNLHEHIGVHYPFTLDPRFQTFDKKLSDPSNIFQFISDRSGPLASTLGLIIALLKSSNPDVYAENSDLPNYELYFADLPISVARKFGLKPELYQQFYGPYENKTIFRCSALDLETKSRGTVTLMSRNPFDPPVIDPNYLQDPRDVEAIVEGLKMCKRLLNTNSLLKLGAKPFETVVLNCEKTTNVDDEYFRCMAKTIPFSTHHPVGTAKMGAVEDPSTVVDPELRVKNIKGLRVVDASIMPQVTSGNTFVPVVMIAEKASDMIKSSIFKPMMFDSTQCTSSQSLENRCQEENEKIS